MYALLLLVKYNNISILKYRYLIKAAMDVKSGKKLPSLISYLAENQGSRFSYTGIIDNMALLKACQYHSVRLVSVLLSHVIANLSQSS